MDPLTIVLLSLGLINTMNKMNTLPVAGLGNRYQDYLPSEFLLKFIKVFESGSFDSQTKYNAYYVNSLERSKGIVTIGNGSTKIYSNDFKFIRDVRITDTLDVIKVLTKNTTLSNEEMAFKLSQNHLLSATRGVYLYFAKDMDIRGVLFDKNVAEHLYEICYGSGVGLAGRGTKLTQQQKNFYAMFLENIKNAQNSFQKHCAILSHRLNYYHSLGSLWSASHGGWTTRMLTVAKYFSGLINESQIMQQKLIYERNYNQKRIDMRTVFGISHVF